MDPESEWWLNGCIVFYSRSLVEGMDNVWKNRGIRSHRIFSAQYGIISEYKGYLVPAGGGEARRWKTVTGERQNAEEVCFITHRKFVFIHSTGFCHL